MNKIAIVGFHNLHLMQFLYKYTNILDRNNIEYDVLYWNRDSISTPCNFKGNPVCFNYETSNYVSKWKKIVGYLKCRKFFTATIKKNNYDKLILLTTQSTIALSPIVLSRYKNRYIYDFRDLTMENIPLYRKMVEKLVYNSNFTSISSNGFIPFIDKDNKLKNKFITAHNCRGLNYYGSNVQYTVPIKIVFWGMIRQFDFQKKICDFFGNDNRFEIRYHGEGASEDLKKYCENKSYKNIIFTGRYFLNEIPDFVKNTNILMNLYENDGKQEHAMTVKFYDGIQYGLPMLIMKNSYMDIYIGDKPFKYSFSFNNNDKDGIINWLQNLNRANVSNSLKEIFQEINHDEEIFKNKLIDFCEEE